MSIACYLCSLGRRGTMLLHAGGGELHVRFVGLGTDHGRLATSGQGGQRRLGRRGVALDQHRDDVDLAVAGPVGQRATPIVAHRHRGLQLVRDALEFLAEVGMGDGGHAAGALVFVIDQGGRRRGDRGRSGNRRACCSAEASEAPPRGLR